MSVGCVNEPPYLDDLEKERIEKEMKSAYLLVFVRDGI